LKTVLLSTTRQFNVGDDFIREGCRYLLDRVFPGTQYVVWDRNPDRLHRGQAAQGNSWHHLSLDGIDLIVIAGTPSWTCVEHRALFECAAREGVPIAFMGIGSAGHRPDQLEALDIAMLDQAQLVIARDRRARVHVLPCPAVFARRRMSRTAVTFGPVVVNQCDQVVNQRVPTTTMRSVSAFARSRDLLLVCHYVHEMLVFRRQGYRVWYSYDWQDYVALYAATPTVVSTRLHGAVVAASYGARTFLIAHDDRVRGAAAEIPGIVLIDIADLARLDLTSEPAGVVPPSWLDNCESQFLGLLRCSIRFR
jgi:hypothetical protein